MIYCIHAFKYSLNIHNLVLVPHDLRYEENRCLINFKFKLSFRKIKNLLSSAPRHRPKQIENHRVIRRRKVKVMCSKADRPFHRGQNNALSSTNAYDPRLFSPSAISRSARDLTGLSLIKKNPIDGPPQLLPLLLRI